MLYIDAKTRVPLGHFREQMEAHIKIGGFRRSRQRDLLLRLLHRQNYPITLERMMEILDDEEHSYSYPTLVRQVNLLTELGWLKCVGGVRRSFILKKSPDEEGLVDDDGA